jgi:competence ComEA-like helix-hairpin-helix protein
MYNKKEVKGISMILIIVLTIIMMAGIKKLRFSHENDSMLSFLEAEMVLGYETENDISHIHEDEHKSGSNRDRRSTIEYKFTEFDPNSVTETELQAMGVSRRVASNWVKYIASGAKFRRKEDVQKIYGLSSATYESISPYMVITIEKENTKSFAAQSPDSSVIKPAKAKWVREMPVIDINLCSADELMQLRGIGEVLSERIIKYRNLLGGFVRIEQLKEVYGLPEETYEAIKPQILIDPKMVNRIRINLADEDILAGFPYIPRRTAQQIVSYKSHHGAFRSIDDLRMIRSLQPEMIEKIEPYLDFGY